MEGVLMLEMTVAGWKLEETGGGRGVLLAPVMVRGAVYVFA